MCYCRFVANEVYSGGLLNRAFADMHVHVVDTLLRHLASHVSTEEDVACDFVAHLFTHLENELVSSQLWYPIGVISTRIQLYLKSYALGFILNPDVLYPGKGYHEVFLSSFFAHREQNSRLPVELRSVITIPDLSQPSFL